MLEAKNQSFSSRFHSVGNTPTIHSFHSLTQTVTNPSVDHTYLPPICCHDEHLSRLKKTHSDPEPNATSKLSSWKAEGQASYQSLSRLQRKNQGQLLYFGCTINVVFNFQLLCDVRE
ncbi:LOW QUALITY PROTEIN: hypothetical protein NC652_004146 [Populus alba x Populus x berolinensis]|nr:LOW QUALITY PROTEIN: hypothetical protein NC652_004146 [Populus alba x Populus x berolinensis]